MYIQINCSIVNNVAEAHCYVIIAILINCPLILTCIHTVHTYIHNII